ncbi:unannotated protein [freshwater metagenome]|uniref:Unannotated protein n=1 Tax=freshwater metagenome TaxID=449393 RepID=A0A6J7XNM4_9ZZZZ|nr:CpaF family protein [Actinomycetota bacterium]
MSLSDRLNHPEANRANSFPHLPSLTNEFESEFSATDYSSIKEDVHKQLINVLGQQLYEGELDTRTLEKYVFESISRVIVASDHPLTAIDRANLMQEIVDEILGLGPLQPLLRDGDVSEIMVNSFDRIYIEKNGKITKTNYVFGSEEHLRRTIDRIVARIGRRIDESSPLVDARLADGSRVHAVIPPIALDGSSLTIRKFASDPFTVKDMVATGTFSTAAMEFMAGCVEGKCNILISGGTGSGKTTTLNVLSSFIPPNERIITIEDAAELQLKQPHVVRLESRPSNVEGKGMVSIRELVRNTLRMRPDRIIVGEVRDAAALDMLQAMNTGHDGSITTVHANSPQEALLRIETLVLMAGIELPTAVIREQMSQALDLIIQQSRLRDGSRQITSISEVTGIVGGEVQTNEIFKFIYMDVPNSRALGKLLPTGNVPNFLLKLAQRGIQIRETLFQP